MKTGKIYFFAFLMLICLSACFGSSVKKDAKKAAELAQRSMEYTRKNELDKAEKYFKEKEAIASKYKESDKAQEFYELYNIHLAENFSATK